MKIGELSGVTGLSVESIRFYEREALMPAPTRTASNYRTYEASHAQRLAFIRHCRALDMTLDEIRTLLKFQDEPSEDCAEVNALLDAHIEHVATRISELKTLQAQLKVLRSRCDASGKTECGILSGLAQAAACMPAPAVAAHSHVAGSHGRSRRPAKQAH